MKSIDKIAKEMGVNPGDVEKRLNPEFTRQFGEHMDEREGVVYFDAEVEEFLWLLFNRSRKPRDSTPPWPAEAREAFGAAPPAPGEIVDPPGGDEAKEEAALAKAPARLPLVYWTQLPAVRVISAPLSYRPEQLIQAVEAQRRELSDFLNQFDQLVEYLAPDDWRRGQARAPRPGKRKPVRIVGAASR